MTVIVVLICEPITECNDTKHVKMPSANGIATDNAIQFISFLFENIENIETICQILINIA